jgi:hypothetical protein
LALQFVDAKFSVVIISWPSFLKSNDSNTAVPSGITVLPDEPVVVEVTDTVVQRADHKPTNAGALVFSTAPVAEPSSDVEVLQACNNTVAAIESVADILFRLAIRNHCSDIY